MTEQPDVLYEVQDRIATITLNRPERLNAYNAHMAQNIKLEMAKAASNANVRVIVLTGAGRGFCAGADMEVLAGDSAAGRSTSRAVDAELDRKFESALGPELSAHFKDSQRFAYFARTKKPIIAAINGDAIGLAATHALLCDITIMAEDARIGDTHVSRVGLVAGDGGTVIWPLLVGINKAKEFLIRGTLLSGKEAERIGLVNHVAPRAEVLAKARAIALELANGPTWAIRWTKLSINQILKERVNLMLEASMALEQVTFATADHKEATMSFKEKRKPKFGQA